MIREIINFTKNLSEEFKNEGIKPREGLHIMLNYRNQDGVMNLDTENCLYEIYSKKMKEESVFIERCKNLSQNAWCIDTNKCFDLPSKAIHSCSPFLVAFKREHLVGGEKYNQNQTKGKTQINERFNSYFEKANALLSSQEEIEKNKVFQHFFSLGTYKFLLQIIQDKLEEQRNKLISELETNKEEYKNCLEKSEKDKLKLHLLNVEEQMISCKTLDDSDYICFYLDKEIEEYINPHSIYLSEKLFNTDKYNTSPDEEGNIYGTSNFLNSFNTNMPFLSHQTASFEITGRISNKEAKALYEFENILSRGTLPKPLPLFIYKDELQQKIVSLFKESECKMGFVEMVNLLWEDYSDDFKNYYFLYWQNTKDGIVFSDFDFVPKFEYELEAEIHNLFNIREKGSKGNDGRLISYPKMKNVFEFEQLVFCNLIGIYSKDRNSSKIDYFIKLEGDELKTIKKQYTNYSYKFIAYAKYRKAVYDFVYKSKRQGIDSRIFSDMVFSHIIDDIKNDNGYGVKDKLNLWFSLYEKFDTTNKKINNVTMASKLKDYQEFVAKLAVGQAELEKANDAHFAFAAGQVIEYVIQKSKTDNKSYQLLEPYLQQAKCTEFKRALANDIARYKHAINDNETRFKNVCAFVQTYETDRNLKELLPEILAGVFAKNEFFTQNYENKENQ